MPRPVELIAHRGSPRRHLENTLAGFGAALADGADGIEFDVHLSADGVAVVHHDPVLGAAAGPLAGRAIASLRVAELAVEVAPGVPLPSLGAVVDAVGGRATLYAEVKSRTGEREVHRVCASSGVPYAIHAFDHRVALRAAGLPGAPAVGILSESYLVDTVAALRAARARDLWQHWSQVDRALVDAVHAADGRVVVWTVNDADRARALAALGVDALCTDDVPLLRAALAEGARG